jgi:hypothetical protein
MLLDGAVQVMMSANKSGPRHHQPGDLFRHNHFSHNLIPTHETFVRLSPKRVFPNNLTRAFQILINLRANHLCLSLVVGDLLREITNKPKPWQQG